MIKFGYCVKKMEEEKGKRCSTRLEIVGVVPQLSGFTTEVLS